MENPFGADKKWLGINWQISLNSGWGVLGLNLALEAERDRRVSTIPLVPTLHTDYFPPDYQTAMAPVLARERLACQMIDEHQDRPFHFEFPVLHSLGNWIGWDVPTDILERVRGSTNLAIIFLEDTELRPRALGVSKQFDLILAGSTWNNQVLHKNGIQNVATFLQGVDLSLFVPARKPVRKEKPFVIFSGGKLEYRKGQDIVIEAFRKFRQRHPNAILAMAWHNPWPKSIGGIDRSGYVTGAPVVNPDGRIDVSGWLEANGIPRSASHDLGPVPNFLMPSVYSQANVAVFPNRCEGGTNLIAMECLACGVPTILSRNTGHLDLIDERHCYPLFEQKPVAPVPPFSGTDGWGESNVDEVVEALERVYADRTAAEQRGAAAARFMQDWSWRKRFEELLQHLERVQ
jgi:glycosyltransferase involved in cell wall biosynthesis